VIISVLAMSFIIFILSMLFARSMVGATLPSQLINLWRVAAACVTMAVVVMIMRYGLQGRDVNRFVESILTALLGAAVYAGALSVLGVRPIDYSNGFGTQG
jgi:hypothetical protein